MKIDYWIILLAGVCLAGHGYASGDKNGGKRSDDASSSPPEAAAANQEEAKTEEEAGTECSRVMRGALLGFRRSLSALRVERDLTIMTDRDFRDAFMLPNGDELIVPDARFDWGRVRSLSRRTGRSRTRPLSLF